MDIRVSAQGLRLEAATGGFVSVKKAQQRHEWRLGAGLREAAET